MTAKLNASQIREVASSHMLKWVKKSKSTFRILHKQTIVQLVNPTTSKMSCNLHGNYTIVNSKLVYVCRNRATPCPKCTEEYEINRVNKQVHEPNQTILNWAKLGGLKVISKLPKLVNLRTTDLELKCKLCLILFKLSCLKFKTWKHDGSVKGCTTCRTNINSFKSDAEYKKKLKEVHKGNITALFEYLPKTAYKYVNGDFKCNKGHVWNTKVLLPLRGYGCRHCSVMNNNKRAYNRKVFIEEVEFTLDSNLEEATLRKLVKQFGVTNIVREPTYIPLYDNKNYYPDFLVNTKEGREILVEVKGPSTLGVTRCMYDKSLEDVYRRFDKVRRQFTTAFAIGKNIRMVVGSTRNNKTILTLLPEDWFTWTFLEIRTFLLTKKHYCPKLTDLTFAKNTPTLH